jgi:serine/threonine-protein kinase
LTNRNLGELLGQSLAGRFQLERVLGKGGYGAVFEATQLSVGRRCAVKVLAPRDGVDAKSMARFEREARSTSRLTHPNTITIYDFGEDREHAVFFIAMEYLEGRDLSDHLQEQTMGVQDVVHVLRQVAASLDDAHRQGIVHRDIKPQNIMICPRPGDPLGVKVIDFGIAKAMGNNGSPAATALTMTGTIVGTPQYMSPEQVRDVDVDGRSDQYSLAACAYVMLAGRPPFLGSSPIDIATRHLTDQPLPVSVLVPSLGLAEAFDDALLRALEKNPADRFATCTAFVDALADAVTTQPMTLASVASEVDEPPSRQDEAAPKETPEVVVSDHAGWSSHTLALRPEAPVLPVDWALDEPSAPIKQPEPSRVRWWMWGGVVTGVLAVGFVGVLLASGASGEDTRKAASAPVEEGVVQGEAQVPAVVVHKTAPASEEAPVAKPEVNTPNVEIPPQKEVTPIAAEEPKPVVEKTPSKVRTKAPVNKAEPLEVLAASQVPVAPAAKETVEVPVTVTIRPWGTLYVDGRKAGTAARQVIPLEVGRHTFELKQDDQTRVKQTVQVDASFRGTVHLVAD